MTLEMIEKEKLHEEIELGKAEGINVGKSEGAHETAKKALDLGLSIEQTSAITGLTTNELLALQNSAMH